MDLIFYAGLFILFYLAFLRRKKSLCIHNWSKWQKYLLTMQIRTCKKCGLTQKK